MKDRAFGHGIATPSAPAIAALNGVLYCVHRGNDNGLWWTTFDRGDVDMGGGPIVRAGREDAGRRRSAC